MLLRIFTALEFWKAASKNIIFIIFYDFAALKAKIQRASFNFLLYDIYFFAALEYGGKASKSKLKVSL
jgi:hypothetical protein